MGAGDVFLFKALCPLLIWSVDLLQSPYFRSLRSIPLLTLGTVDLLHLVPALNPDGARPTQARWVARSLVPPLRHPP